MAPEGGERATEGNQTLANCAHSVVEPCPLPWYSLLPILAGLTSTSGLSLVWSLVNCRATAWLRRMYDLGPRLK